MTYKTVKIYLGNYRFEHIISSINIIKYISYNLQY